MEVREFRNSWTTYSPRTAGKHIERLKRFFNWCVENRWLDSSPAKPLKVPKVGDTDVVPFSEDEVEKILKACDEHDGVNQKRLRVLTDLMLESGLRISDAVMISKDRIVKTRHGYAAVLRTAKTGTEVSCPLPDKLGKAILSLEGNTPFWSGDTDWRVLGRIGGRFTPAYSRPLAFKGTHINSATRRPNGCCSKASLSGTLLPSWGTL